MNITNTRLSAQHLAGPKYDSVAAAVRHLGAVQSQDYSGAAWAVAQRVDGITRADFDNAFDAGQFVRTHVMRPTWHFVAPEDVRWMLKLTAPRIMVAARTYQRNLGLDQVRLDRINAAVAEQVAGTNGLLRAEILANLRTRKLIAADANGLHELNQALIVTELAGIICNGALKNGKQTYALLDERVPAGLELDHDAAVAELAKRYFLSHGPATLKDFTWWSGLTVAQAKLGVELAAGDLATQIIDGVNYWLDPNLSISAPEALYLLPNYDEYLVAYADRSAMIGPIDTQHLDSRGNVLFNHTIVSNGRVVGTWRPVKKGSAVIVEASLFQPVPTVGLEVLIDRYSKFLDTPVKLMLKAAA